MNIKKTINIILILVFVVSLAPGGSTYASQTGKSNNQNNIASDSAVPAPTNGPKPTVHLSVTHGYVGQSVIVSGNVPSDTYTGVRVSWVIADTTYTAAVVNRNANLSYQATTGVPHTLETGAAKICAALTGTDIAEFACQDFTLDPAPNGSVSGSIPTGIQSAGAALGGTVNLMDRGGNILYSGAIGGSGTFNIPNVSPGIYQVAVTGNLSQPVISAPVIVNPGSIAQVGFQTAIKLSSDPVTGQACIGNFSAQVSAVHNTATSNNFLYQIQYLPYFYNLSNIWNSTPRDFDFGLYISGVSLVVPFSSYLQVTGGVSVSEVQYHVKLPNGTIVPIGTSSDAGSNYGVTYDVGNLTPGDSQLVVSPVVSGVRQCPSLYKIRTNADPMKDPIMQPGASTTWDNGNNRYSFQGTLVDVGGLLPFIFPDPPPSLPLVGTLTNEFSAGVGISGNITLDGVIHIQMMKAEALAELFSIKIFDNKLDLLKAGENTTNIDPRRPLDSNIAFGPTTLWHDSIKTPVFKGVIASFWGIVSIDASVSVGLDGKLAISGTIYPFQPNLDATLVTTITPSLTISIWVDILLGVASAGADATAAVGFGLPLRVSTNDPNHPEVVWLDTPCFSLSVTLAAWARVNLLFWSQTWNIGSFTLVNYSKPDGCTALANAIKAVAPDAVISPPRMMASPAVATSPTGGALSVYIVDTTPGQQQPTPKVAASFWNAASQTWQTPAYLTSGDHAVQDPTAAFAGPGDTPIVAWTETNLTLQQEQGKGSDINAYMQAQEIFYTTWNGSAWNTPTRLTTNTLPDGRASIAGNSTGATLAWVENIGGLTSTSQKMRIAVTEWDPASGAWGTISLLNGNPLGDAMNIQPSAARFDLPGVPPQRAVAWTVDIDGNPSTNSDRHLVVARWDAANGWSIPTFDLTGQLPNGAESPSLSFDPQSGLAHMAFVLRHLDEDNLSDTGIGNRAILWSADANVDKFWSAAEVTDNGQSIFAEKPVLQISNTGERLLLFRRFGAPGTNGVLGQLALAQGLMAGGYSMPLYLTDAPVNHWQQSFAINPVSNDAMILNVNRSTLIGIQNIELGNASNSPVSTTRTLALTSGNDTVESFNVSSSADLALDPSLDLSAQHAPAGDSVVVTATLSNLGRGVATSGAVPISVCLYSGVPPTGTQLGCNDLPVGTTLDFSASMPITFNIMANGGAQPIYAQVFSNGDNGDITNDIATGALGAIPAPQLTSVGEDKIFLVNALGIRWVPPLVPGVVGFRILRSTDSGATYELVGETFNSYLPDLLLERGVNYCYVIQAYDSAGTLSPKSNQICATLPRLPSFLPVIVK